MITIKAVPVSSCQRSGSNVFNILLLGSSQAGKSTFVQAVKQYADPNHVIEEDTIGNGNIAKTTVVHKSCVDTWYPKHEVVIETPSSDGDDAASFTVVNIDAILHENQGSWEDYEDALGYDEKKKLHRCKHPKEKDYADAFECYENKNLHRCHDSKEPEMHHIHLFDTPGLDDTDGRDEVHMASIIRSLQTAGGIHLVLVIVGDSAFTPGFQSALTCYMDVLPEFQGIIAFVHTKFDYVNFHPCREDKIAGMDERKKMLHVIMGRSSCKHFMIDCDFEVTTPIRRCITQNTIRQILKEAKTNLPVSINAETVRKTPTMRKVDRILIKNYNDTIIAITDTLRTKDVEQSIVLDKVFQLDTRLNSIQAIASDKSAYISAKDTTEYVFLDERHFGEPWAVKGTDRCHTLVFPEQAHTIRQLVIAQEHIKIKNARGGIDHQFWELDFKRKKFRNGMLRVKFYTTSKEKFKNEIEHARKIRAIKYRDFATAMEDWNDYTTANSSLLQDIRSLVNRNKLVTDVIAKAKEPSVNLAEFEALVAMGTYSGDLAAAAKVVEGRYLEAVSKVDRQHKE